MFQLAQINLLLNDLKWKFKNLDKLKEAQKNPKKNKQEDKKSK